MKKALNGNHFLIRVDKIRQSNGEFEI